MPKVIRPPVWSEEQRSAIQKLSWYKELLDSTGRKGSIQAYYAWAGGEHKGLMLLGGYSNFLLAMKEAGYTKSYISEIRKKLREKYID